MSGEDENGVVSAEGGGNVVSAEGEDGVGDRGLGGRKVTGGLRVKGVGPRVS